MEMKMMMTLITHLRLVASPGTVKSEAAPSKVTCEMGLIIIIYIYNHDYLYFSWSIIIAKDYHSVVDDSLMHCHYRSVTKGWKI